jgi:hypothetical protein
VAVTEPHWVSVHKPPRRGKAPPVFLDRDNASESDCVSISPSNRRHARAFIQADSVVRPGPSEFNWLLFVCVLVQVRPQRHPHSFALVRCQPMIVVRRSDQRHDLNVNIARIHGTRDSPVDFRDPKPRNDRR